MEILGAKQQIKETTDKTEEKLQKEEDESGRVSDSYTQCPDC